MTRTAMKLVASIAACALFAASAAAQDVASFYKGKTVRIVVGFSAGAATTTTPAWWRAT